MDHDYAGYRLTAFARDRQSNMAKHVPAAGVGRRINKVLALGPWRWEMAPVCGEYACFTTLSSVTELSEPKHNSPDTL